MKCVAMRLNYVLKKKRLNFRVTTQHNWEGLCDLVKRKNIHSVKL